MFQQVAEVFHRQALIDTNPQGAVFKFALCSCLYNVIQAVRQYLAHSHGCAPQSLSSEPIFRNVCKQLIAASHFLSHDALHDCIDHAPYQQIRQRLANIFEDQRTQAWLKSPPQKRKNRQPKRHVPGGHSSVHKLIQKAKSNS